MKFILQRAGANKRRVRYQRGATPSSFNLPLPSSTLHLFYRNEALQGMAVQFTQYTVKCTVYSVQCTVYRLPYTGYSAPCMVDYNLLLRGPSAEDILPSCGRRQHYCATDGHSLMWKVDLSWQYEQPRIAIAGMILIALTIHKTLV